MDEVPAAPGHSQLDQGWIQMLITAIVVGGFWLSCSTAVLVGYLVMERRDR